MTGLYALYPRAAYYALKKGSRSLIHMDRMPIARLSNHSFSGKSILAEQHWRLEEIKLPWKAKSKSLASISRFSARFNTYSTGGSLAKAPTKMQANVTQYPDELGFDHMQTFFVGVQANPAPNVQADVEFSMVGNVADNPIDGAAKEILLVKEENPFRLYGASLKWNEKWFNLDAFYREATTTGAMKEFLWIIP